MKSLAEYNVSRLDQTILALEKVLEECKTQRATLLRRCIPRKTPLPILPPEVLSEIFIIACTDSPYFRLCISQVCRAWRHAALVCSELWTHVHADLQKPKLALKEYLDTCVQRAKSRPLTLLCREDTYREDVFDILLESTAMSRWKEIKWDVFSSTRTLFGQRLKLLVGNLSNTLESLTLHSLDAPIYASMTRW